MPRFPARSALRLPSSSGARVGASGATPTGGVSRKMTPFRMAVCGSRTGRCRRIDERRRIYAVQLQSRFRLLAGRQPDGLDAGIRLGIGLGRSLQPHQFGICRSGNRVGQRHRSPGSVQRTRSRRPVGRVQNSAKFRAVRLSPRSNSTNTRPWRESVTIFSRRGLHLFLVATASCAALCRATR